MITISRAARVWVLLASSLPSAAQVDLPSAERREIRTVTGGQEWDLVQRIVGRLENQTRFQFPRDVRIVLIDRPEIINAWADPGQRVIVLTTGIVRFNSHSEGELACIIGHETGHILDQSCGPLLGRPSSKLDELLGAIFGGGRGAALAKGEKLCEQRADEIGLQFMAGAGYNPYDCAAFFGRMAMFQGDPGVLNKWLYASTHPLDWERIMDLRRTLARYQQRFGAAALPTPPSAPPVEPTTSTASAGPERSWKTIQDPRHRWRFRISEQYLYGERVLSEQERQAGDFDTVDARKEGDRYFGTQRVRMTLRTPQGSRRACQWEFAVELTTVGSERIEGRWEGYPPGARVEALTCFWSAAKTWQSVSWIPE
jgi:hypothetical protein